MQKQIEKQKQIQKQIEKQKQIKKQIQRSIRRISYSAKAKSQKTLIWSLRRCSIIDSQ